MRLSQLIKNTLEFDPEILKRYVNFMNNPDEKTAVDQFGKGDKYFGVCTLMATLPGLPMFGHGQVEGFSEKYGMEFTKPLWQEVEDDELIRRHQRLIFPQLHQRELFAGVEHFRLFDLFTSDGQVNENVFAFSNRHQGKSVLVLFNNKYSQASGWIKTSCAIATRGHGEKRPLSRENLAKSLGINASPGSYTIFRDQVSGMEYIRSSAELYDNGLPVYLNAYECQVFLDFRQVKDDHWKSYSQLCVTLGGRGVPDIELALKEMNFQPVLIPFQELANKQFIEHLLASRLTDASSKVTSELSEAYQRKRLKLLNGAGQIAGMEYSTSDFTHIAKKQLNSILSLQVIESRYPLPAGTRYIKQFSIFSVPLLKNEKTWLALLTWSFLSPLELLVNAPNSSEQVLAWMDEWQLSRRLQQVFSEMGLDEYQINRSLLLTKILLLQQCWFENAKRSPRELMLNWLALPEINKFLGVHRYKDMLWFKKEAFEEFLWWMSTVALISKSREPTVSTTEVLELVVALSEINTYFKKALKKSKFQISGLLEAL